MADTKNFRLEGPSRASDPAVGGEAINFSSDQTLTKTSRGIYLSTAGTLHVLMHDGSDLTLILATGWHPLAVTKIYSTGSSTAVGFVFW